MEIDVERLREDLKDYFGTAISYNPNAVMDLIKVEKASAEELLRIVYNTPLNINDYIVEDYERRF